jgi:tetratricopeptide (TPR) repeat protein
MRNAERIAALCFASAMAPAAIRAQAPPAGPQAAQLSAATEHLQQGKTEQAIRECKAVLAADPRSAPAHMLLGLAYLAQRSVAKVADAKAELQQALDSDPNLLWARFYLARLYLDQGSSEKAREQLERGLSQAPGAPPFLALLGEARRKLGDPSASLELNRKALEGDPTITPAHYFLALAYLDLKQDDAALAELQKAIQARDVTPEMYTTLASLYIRKQQLAEAEDSCRKAIALDPSRSDAYLNLARVYNARQASDKALEALRSALPEGKEYSVSEYYQGLEADVAVERGAAYTDKKIYAQAISAYARALDFDPSRAVAHRRLAELYRLTGDAAAAARHTSEADQLEKGKGQD